MASPRQQRVARMEDSAVPAEVKDLPNVENMGGSR
jgi:hypothetical protein